MDKQSHKETMQYLEDIVKVTEDPGTESLLRQLMSFLESLSDDECLPENKPLLCTNMGIGMLRIPLGDSRLNTDFAVRYLNEALPLWHEGQNQEKAVTMHTLGIAHNSRRKVDPVESIERAIKWFERTLSTLSGEDAPLLRASTFYELGNAYIERTAGDPTENKEKAIEYLNRALEIRTREALPNEWAMTMYAFGNAYMMRIEGDPAENMEKAIDYYNQALTQWTEEADPMNWASTKKALAEAFTVRLRNDPAENKEMAIACLEQVRSIWTKEVAPQNWAGTLYALGNAYEQRPKGNPAENQEMAIGYFNHALSVWTRDQAPMDWAMTMHGLGHAHRERINGNPADNKEKAIEYFTQVLSVWTKKEVPQRWAFGMFGLGNAYGGRIKGNTADNIETAIDCIEQTLSVWKKDVVPMNWVMAMYVRGQFYNVRSKGDPAGNKEESIDCYKQTESVWTKETAPTYWAMAMHELGNTYMGRVNGNPEDNREQAIECFEKALTVRKKEVLPMDWAASMCELGNAYATGIKENPQEREEKAIGCINEALCEWTKDRVPMKWAEANYGLALIYARRLSGAQLDNHRKAVHHCQAALSVVEAETNPQLYYLARFGMGYSLVHQYKLQKDGEVLDESFRAFGDALTLISEIYIDTADPKARKDYLRQRISQFHGAIGFMLEHKRHSDSMYWLEKIRSQSLLEDINLDQLTPQNEPAAKPAQEYWRLCSLIRGYRAALSTEKEENTMPPGSHGHYSQRQEQYKELKGYLNRRKAVLEELKDLDPDYVKIIQAEPLTEQELYSLLSQTTSAAVECFVPHKSKDLYFLIAYAEKSTIAYKIIQIENVASLALEPTIGEFLESSGSGCLPNLASLNTMLEKAGKLMKSLAAFLRERRITKIYLSPHAFLHAIPLHAAFWPDTNTYFIEDVEVCYTPSLTLSYRLFSSKTRTGRKAMVLFHSSEEKYLKYGKEELENLSHIYGENQLIPLDIPEKATLEKLASSLEESQGELSLLELICHGKASPDGIEIYLKDAVSHVQMIKKLNLSGLPLAVLAACETGRSDEWSQTYEEYVALDSVFLQMGAKGVISSLFPINDQGTSEVMKEFHKQLKQNGHPVKALHEAQRKILEEGFVASTDSGSRSRAPGDQPINPPSSKHPYYWACLKYSGTF